MEAVSSECSPTQTSALHPLRVRIAMGSPRECMIKVSPTKSLFHDREPIQTHVQCSIIILCVDIMWLRCHRCLLAIPILSFSLPPSNSPPHIQWARRRIEIQRVQRSFFPSFGNDGSALFRYGGGVGGGARLMSWCNVDGGCQSCSGISQQPMFQLFLIFNHSTVTAKHPNSFYHPLLSSVTANLYRSQHPFMPCCSVWVSSLATVTITLCPNSFQWPPTSAASNTDPWHVPTLFSAIKPV